MRYRYKWLVCPILGVVLVITILSNAMSGRSERTEDKTQYIIHPQQGNIVPVSSDEDYSDQIELQIPEQQSHPIVEHKQSVATLVTSKVNKVKATTVSMKKIRVAFAAIDGLYAKQAVVMMKSILMFTDHLIYFKAFTDQVTANYIQTHVFQFPPVLKDKCKLVFYDLNVSFMILQDKVDDVKKFARSGLPGAMLKPLIPALLPNYDHILIVDTDVLFFNDINILYNKLHLFQSTHIMAMGDEGDLYIKPGNVQPFYPPFGLNSGVILVNIPKTISAGFLGSIANYYSKDFNKVISHHDQGLMNLYFSDHPDQLYHLDCDLVFHADIDACTYVFKPGVDRRCQRAGVRGAFILHGGSHRFMFKTIAKSNITAATKDIEQQTEYELFYKAFDSIDMVNNMTWNYWDVVLSGFLDIRNHYCKNEYLYSYGLLTKLKESLAKLLL